MSRVISDTTLRRVLAASLITLAGTLAACGDSTDTPTAGVSSTPPAAASSPAPVASTPAAPAKTTPAKKSSSSSSEKSADKTTAAAGDTSSSDAQASDASGAKPAKTPVLPEDTKVKKKSGAAQVKDPISKRQIDSVVAALKKAGYKPIPSPAHGDVLTAIQVGNVSAVFYKTAAQAKTSAAQFQAVIDRNPKAAQLEVAGSRVYFLGTTKGMTPKLKAQFNDVSDVSEKSLSRSS